MTWYSFAFFLYKQTLTKLNFSYKRIGNQGAQHLAIALQENKVMQLKSLFLLLLFNHSFSIAHRRLPHYIFKVIRSVIQEYNIYPMF